MGGKNSKPVEKSLPTNLDKKVKELFYKIDKDKSNSIERSEAKEYWKKNFSQVNTIALFDQVDEDGNGTIEIAEWIQHWIDVYKTGKYTEEYLINEVIFFKFALE